VSVVPIKGVDCAVVLCPHHPSSFNRPRTPKSVERSKDLCSNQRLLLGTCSWRGLELLLRRSREVLTLVSRDVLLLDRSGFGLGDGGRNRAASATNHLLSLGCIFSCILLCGLGGSGSMVAGEFLDLLGLGVDDVGCVLDVVVNQLLVRLVDERGEEDDRGGDQGEAPEWDDLDQVVREESANKGLFFD
jgi:hypothetical protein